MRIRRDNHVMIISNWLIYELISTSRWMETACGSRHETIFGHKKLYGIVEVLGLPVRNKLKNNKHCNLSPFLPHRHIIFFFVLLFILCSIIELLSQNQNFLYIHIKKKRKWIGYAGIRKRRRNRKAKEGEANNPSRIF